MTGTVEVVTLASARTGEAVFTADVVNIGGGDVAGEADIDAVLVGMVLEHASTVFTEVVVPLVEFNGLACTVFIVVVVTVGAVDREDVEDGEAVTGLDKLAAGAEAPGAVGGIAEACSKSFAAVVVVTGFTVVATALTGFDITVVSVVAGTDVGTALTGIMGGVVSVVATGAAAVVVLAELGSVVFTVVEVGGFGSTGDVEAKSVGLTVGRVDETALGGGSAVVVVGVSVTGILADVESMRAETWVDAELKTGAGGELTVWTEVATVRGAVPSGAGAVGTWTEAETGVED